MNSLHEPTLSSADLAVLTEYQRRQQVRGSFLAWCREVGYEPAAHHRLIIAEVETLVENLIRALVRGHEVEGEKLRLMVMTPPGSAKSTYLSKLLPPWFLAQINRLKVEMTKAQRHFVPLGILACSHSATLAGGFGKAARNLVDANERWLGYKLNRDSRASEEWAVSNGGYYLAAGCLAGIAGQRCHLGLIDDFCGVEADAGNKLFNDNCEVWYENDFKLRMQPISAQVIIFNHRNEDDLGGRILVKEAAKWRVIRLRLLIQNEEQAEDDPLGRSIGQRLWPEYFTEAQVLDRMNNPRASGIEQQAPSPAEGDLFKKEWLRGYDAKEIPTLQDSSGYGASDHAVRTKKINDDSCIGIGRFKNGILYIHPDLVWKKLPTNEAVKQMLRLMKEQQPITWWAEKENISGSIGPFLQEQQLEQKIFVWMQEVSTGNKDKIAMAQSIIGLMSMGLVRFPKFATWWPRAEYQILKFPNGKNDDFITFISLLGKGINGMRHVQPKPSEITDKLVTEFRPTIEWCKRSDERKKKLRLALLNDD